MVSELRAANPTVLTTLWVSQDKLGCEVVLCLVPAVALLLLQAPSPRSPLPANDFLKSTNGLSAIGRRCSGPLPQASNCRWVTASDPAQPLVGAAVGPSPKPATARERPLVEHSVKGRQSGGPHTKSEVRGESQPCAASEPRNRLGDVSWGVQSPHQGHPLAGSRPWGGDDPLPPFLPQWPNGSGRLWDQPPLGSLRILRPVGSWAPGSLNSGGSAGLGTWTWGTCQLKFASSARPGHWREDPDWVLGKRFGAG